MKRARKPVLTDHDLSERIRRVEFEALQLSDEHINKRRALIAETLVLDRYRELILNSPNWKAFLQMLKKEHSEVGNLNFCAGLERAINWIESMR